MTIEDFRFSSSDITSLIPLRDASFPDSTGYTSWGGKGHSNYSLADFAGDILPDSDMAGMTINQLNAALIECNLMPLDLDVYEGEVGFSIRVDNEYFIVPGERFGKRYFKAAQFQMGKPVLSCQDPESPTDFWTGTDIAEIILNADNSIDKDAIVYLARCLWEQADAEHSPREIAENAAAQGWLDDYHYGKMPESYKEHFA